MQNKLLGGFLAELTQPGGTEITLFILLKK